MASETSSPAAHGFDAIKLTPPLALTIALMFMVASDGHLDAAESSQIQSAIGQNDELVRFASAYVRAVPFKAFLSRVSHGLSGRDKVCILSNVFDAVLADGRLHEMEQKTFELLQGALGVSRKDFAQHLKTLRLKNDRSVLGHFRLTDAARSMTPHLALAASVLYMMSADGSIDKHEIGRLETLVVEFEGLQKLSVSYVKATKRERFIQEAAHALSPDQKIFIALNVYDTMTADGVIALTEDKIFAALLDAFGLTQADFALHLKVLEDKNLKPFDTRKVNIDQLFSMVQDSSEVTQVDAGSVSAESMGQVMSRTMHDNIANVKQDLGGSANVVQIQSNAMGELNVQKIDADSTETHREKIDASAQTPNRQQLDSDSIHNVVMLDTAPEQTHRQAVAQEALDLGKNRGVSVAIRIDSLSDDIHALHEQLTKFENQNKRWLNIGKVFEKAQAENRQKIQTGSDLKSIAWASKNESTSESIITAQASSQSSPPSLPPVTTDVSRGKVPSAGGASSAGLAKRRGGGGYFHQGRVWDMPHKPSAFGVREFVLALSLTVCVSNLGATKLGKFNEAQGMLTRLVQTPK